jgi:hypothetical protein
MEVVVSGGRNVELVFHPHLSPLPSRERKEKKRAIREAVHGHRFFGCVLARIEGLDSE